MLALTLFLTTFNTIATLVLSWIAGVALVAALFLYNRRRIRMHDGDM